MLSRKIRWKDVEVVGGEVGWPEVGGSRWEVEGSPARPGRSWSLVWLEVTAEVDAGRGFAGRSAVFVGAGRRVGLAGSELLLPGNLRGRSLTEP